MSGITVEQLLPVPCLGLGEGPHWIQQQQALVFVDAFAMRLRRYFPKSGRHQVLHIDDGGIHKTVTFVIPIEDDNERLVVGLGNTVSVVHWSPSHPDTHTTKPLATLHTTTDDHFNDAKCDPQGRLWAGTMTPLGKEGQLLEFNNSSLFKLTSDLTCTTQVRKVTISNGMAWSKDNKFFYYIDSPAKAVYLYDYEATTGTIRNQRVLVNYEEAGLKEQVPDGMTIDIEGNLWVACFGGGQVICVDPKSGEVLRKVSVPSPQVTSVCWGGENYDTLFVTSGTHMLTPEKRSVLPAAGGTFAIKGLGTKGVPSSSFKLDPHVLQKAMKV